MSGTLIGEDLTVLLQKVGLKLRSLGDRANAPARTYQEWSVALLREVSYTVALNEGDPCLTVLGVIERGLAGGIFRFKV